MGGVEGGKGNRFRQLLSWERERKGGIEVQASMAVALCSCSCNDERRKMAIGWAEKIWALVEEIGPKEKGKERKKIQK